MTLTTAAFRAIAVCSTVAVASAVFVPCSAGVRVHSLSVWSGYWVDGLVMKCTGDGDEQTIPPEFNDHPGGEESEEICAGTGGVERIKWGVPNDLEFIMVYVNITCLDNKTFYLANGRPYDEWNVTGNRVVSCEDGEYVQGVEYDITILENSSFPYYLNNINFMCSSSTLDPLCTCCSDDTTLKSEEDQPEHCELPSCSEAECCEPNANETEATTTAVIIGVVSTVVAVMIISGIVWTFKRLMKRHAVPSGYEVCLVKDTPSVKSNVTIVAVITMNLPPCRHF